MKFEDVISQFNEIFIDVLEDDDIVLSRETTAADVEEWDSLNHIQLVVEIERHFKVKFTSMEIQSFKNVGEMCDAVVTKLQ
ncbi:MAG: acyl carrier protein [Roseivirga sp.]|nr:acyl carrier protein [Roseivirga sp.]